MTARTQSTPPRWAGCPASAALGSPSAWCSVSLAAGRSVDEVLAGYPYLERPDVLAALEFAAAIVNEREVPIARPA